MYSTNANASNILSMTAGCREYRLFVPHSSFFTIHRRMLQRSQDPLDGWEGGGIRAVYSQENH